MLVSYLIADTLFVTNEVLITIVIKNQLKLFTEEYGEYQSDL